MIIINISFFAINGCVLHNRLRLVQEIQRASELSLKEWESDKSSSSLTILTDVERKTSPINILKSELLQGLVFTSLTEDLYGYLEQKMFDYYNAKTKNHEPKETSHLLRTGLPAFLYCVLPKVSCLFGQCNLQIAHFKVRIKLILR